MIRLHKKGVEMQVFTFIFALILIVFILAYGLRSISRIQGVGENVDLGDFVFRLRDQVDMMVSFEIDSTKQVKLFLPNKVTQVCFFNGEHEITLHDDDLDLYFETNLGKNVFAAPFSFAQNIFLIEHLRPDHAGDNPLCFATKGVLQFTLTTVLGDDDNIYVEVSR